METIILKDIRKVYKNGVEALKDINISINAGEIVGLIGPNGAGKTTLINIILGLLKPTEGVSKILGVDTDKMTKRERKKIGFILDGPGLYDDLTVDENIKFWSELYEVSQIRGEALLNQWGLYENRGSLVKELSAGMKQKLAISRAFLHDPSIVLMDEPTSNLDPVARKNMVEFLKSLHDKEKTLLITSHDLFDIERICSRIILLRRGQIVVSGNMEELKEALGVRIGVKIKVSNKIPRDIVNEISKDSEVNIIGEKELMLSGDKISPSSVVRYLVNKGIDVERVEEEKVTLEDIYTYIVKEDEE